MQYISHKTYSLLLFLALLFFSLPAFGEVDAPPSARDSGAIQNGRTHVDVLLITDHEQVKPGDTLRVGVLFDLEESWHIYWENPGDAGLPTSIEWNAPGLEFGPLKWAAPGIYPEADGSLITFGYDNQVLLFSEARVLDDLPPEIEIQAEIEYLACHDACLPGEHGLSRSIASGETSLKAPRAIQALFDDYSLQSPQNADALGITSSASLVDEHTALLEVVLCEGPDENCPAEAEIHFEDMAYAMVASARSSSPFTINSIGAHPTVFKGWVFEVQLQNISEVGAQLATVFRLDDGAGSILPIELTAALQESDSSRLALLSENLAASAQSPGAPSEGGPNLFYILLMAFLGGMILNLMPCVFPVLAIKVASFTEMASKSREQILAHGLAYTAGITGSLVLLGAVVAGLQMAGTQVGWGFQFQQPLFLAALALIIFIFALNSFGVFEVTLRSQKLAEKADNTKGLRRSFAEGILAVVLATPCSAPFLGTAVGFALTAHPAVILLIFFVLGLGLAAPFVALTLIPGAAKVLPRPGAWMSHLKHFLGFALLGAVIWLVWLVGRLAGVDAMGRIMVLLGSISLSAWIYGLVQFKPWKRPKEIGIALSLAILVGAVYFAFPLEDDYTAGEFSSAQNQGPVDWKPWSEEAVQTELQQGRKVFVNFTADWCLTCKANERHAIVDRQVLRAMRANNIAMFKADWTRPDETIRQTLADHGKGGVPMYLFYNPSEGLEAEVLPELLSPSMLIDRFDAP